MEKIYEIDSVEEINLEIEKSEKELPNFKNSLKWSIPLLFILSLLLPFLSGKTGARPLVESIGYPKGVILCCLILSSIWIYMYYKTKKKSEERTAQLKLRKRVLEKRN